MIKRCTLKVALVALLAAFTHNATAAETLSWTGCGITKKAFMAEMANAYQQKTGIAIKLSGGGATKGIRAVSAGSSDLGGSCRHWLRGLDSDVHPEETDAELVQVAWDALVVIAHPNNPVNNVTTDQLKQIYQGKITSWADLGGTDKRIALVTRDGKSSGVGYMMRHLVFGDPNYEFEARSLKVKSTGPLEKKVESVKTALAMDGISSAKRREVKFLALDGVEPTKENIGAGSYSLYRPLYLAINKNKASQAARDFVDFVLSEEGQAIISQQGTVNLGEGAALNPLWEAKKESFGI